MRARALILHALLSVMVACSARTADEATTAAVGSTIEAAHKKDDDDARKHEEDCNEKHPRPPRWDDDARLTAASVTSTSLSLTWAGAESTKQVAHYRIFMNGALLATVPPTPRSYAVTGLTPATRYAFHVEAGNACDAYSDDGPSTVVSTAAPVGAPTGATCSTAAACVSGNCVDGVCCDGPCGGQCEACNAAGSVGTCKAVTGAPVGSRSKCSSDGGACGGRCDGVARSSCTYPPATVGCGSPSCTGGVATSARQCDGAGACAPATTATCSPLVCGASACLTSCATDADCVGGDRCSAGSCVAKAANGNACGGASECASGNCVDGVCCDSACGGQCEACNVPGAVGTCAATNGAPVGARPACASDGSGCGGSCTGASRTACTYPSSSTVCRAASCTGGTAAAVATCNGAGACPASSTVACAPFICGSSACLTACAADADCISADHCAGGSCVPRVANGASCTGSSTCISGNCVDGVCCNSACGGQCEACNLPGAVGTCSAVTGSPVAGRATCAGDGSACAGRCDGSTRATCTFPGAATSCRAASCAAGVATSAASCTGTGTCPAPVTTTCAPFVCGVSSCFTACTTDAGCVAGDFCSAGSCTPKGGNGATCSTVSACASGNCVDGVCCDTACTGQCEACGAPGAMGTCTAVTGAPVGGRTACASDGGLCGGSCDGTSRTACTYPSAATSCRPASCSGGVATAAGACNSAGACGASTTTSCSPYACGASSCLTTCSTALDCAANAICSAGSCVQDVTPPTWVTGQFTFAHATQTSLTLSWYGAQDDGGIASYSVYQDKTLLTTVGGSTTSLDVAALAVGTSYGFSVQATDAAGNVSTDGPELRVRTVPADPAAVAPPTDHTVATNIASTNAYLISGANPIQTGVAPGTLDANRFAIVRGHVSFVDASPAAGVAVRVLNHPELGETVSRADGMFDLAVNGGSKLTFVYTLPGAPTVTRDVEVPWRDYVFADDVVMTLFDRAVTAIDLTRGSAGQVARANAVTDSDGTRRTSVYFPTGTTAMLRFADGTTKPISMLHVRATEYTVGASGPAAMPAALPPTSAYTYAVELSVDEAVRAGAASVVFNQPVFQYVENFLGVQTGQLVPNGTYDRLQGAWVGNDPGIVLKVLSVTGGLAKLDVDNSGTPASLAALGALGIGSDEQMALAAMYAPGQSFWRLPQRHFSAVDGNFGLALNGSEGPSQKPSAGNSIDHPCIQSGSKIECQNQILGESLSVAGTPFSLNYSSDRVPGRVSERLVTIHLTGPTPPPVAVDVIHWRLTVGGNRIFGMELPKTKGGAFAPNLSVQVAAPMTDGATGRDLVGRQRATVTIGYHYNNTQYIASGGIFGGRGVTVSSSGSGGGSGGGLKVFSIGLTRQLPSDPFAYDVTKNYNIYVGTWDARAADALGGLTLDVHHVFDPWEDRVYYGTGDRRTVSSLGLVIDTLPNTPGIAARNVVESANGTVFILDQMRLARTAPGGGIVGVTSVTGPMTTADGVPAARAILSTPTGLALGPDQSIYVIDGGGSVASPRIRRILPDFSLITTIAGNGTQGFSGDNGPATGAQFNNPTGIAVGGDGSVYVADSSNHRVRLVDTNGLIRTVAGNGAFTGSLAGDGGLAIDAPMLPTAVALDRQGNLYILDNNQYVRRVDVSGIITTIAGQGLDRVSDGVPATDSRIENASDVSVAPNGDVIIVEHAGIYGGPNRILRIDDAGIISILAGFDGGGGIGGDGGPAKASKVGPLSATTGPSGTLWVADFFNSRVRRVRSPAPGVSSVGDYVVPAEDGSVVFVFDGAGRHKKTVDSLTGAVLYTFAYDGGGLLSSVTDVDGDVTTLTRELAGGATLTGPFGQKTVLTVDAHGYLATATNPLGEAVGLAFDSAGLLQTLTDPRGFVHSFAWETDGRLKVDADPAGGSKSLVRTDLPNGWETDLSTALGRTTKHRVLRNPDGSETRSVTDPAGTTSTASTTADQGATTTTLADGSSTTTTSGPDPRFGMLSPRAATGQVTLPSGLTSNSTFTRAVTLASTDVLSVVKQTDTVVVNGSTWTRIFDAPSNTLKAISPLGRTTTLTFDARGRVTNVAVPSLNPVGFTFDAHGRLASVASGARTSTRAYDANGFLQTITDPAGRTTSFQRDSLGRTVQQTLTDGSTLTFAYDPSGNLTALTPPGRTAHDFTYTSADQLASYAPPPLTSGPTATSYAYDADHALTGVTKADASVLTRAYDPITGRLSSLTYPEGTLTYGYDASTGNLHQIVGPGATLTYGYDGGLLKSTAWSAGPVVGSVERSYDNFHRVVSTTVNGGMPVAVAYDGDGLVTSIGAMTIARDPGNGMTTGTSLGAVTDSLTYDAYGAVQAYVAKAGTTAIYTEALERDSLERIIKKTETLAGTTHVYQYSYDTAGRLSGVMVDGVTTATYAYDANGNRLSKTTASGVEVGTYDAQDRMLAYGGATYTYTPNGEVATKTDARGTTAYSWDSLGHLVSVARPGGLPLIEYVYDPVGRRIAKKVGGAQVKGWLYGDSIHPVAELDATGAVVDRIAGPYITRGTSTYRVVRDHLGSVRAVTDASSGAVVQSITYGEFGSVTADSAPGFQSLAYANGVYDVDTGLVHYGFRDYDPSTGRWIRKDPRGLDAGPNVFVYADSDPINNVDRDGLTPTSEFVWADPLEGFGANVSSVVDAFVDTIASPAFAGLLVVIGGGALFPGDSSAGENWQWSEPFVPTGQICSAAMSATSAGPSELNSTSDNTAEKDERRVKAAERELRTNRPFRRWFHQQYKPGQVMSDADRSNPDLSPEEVADAFDEWKSEGGK